jgi:flagellar biosynthesis/type III secretory pathway M-ring protein FliF/YscJ
MNPIVGLIFAILMFIVFVISLRSYIRRRQEKKRQQQEQCIEDEDGDREEIM